MNLYRPLPDGCPLFFLHIPKTAGMSLITLLWKAFPERHGIDESTTREELTRRMSATGGKRQLVYGHYAFGIHPPDLEVRYVTLLRHPVERVLSAYYYSLRRPEWKAEGSLKEWLEAPGNLHNQQTARLVRGELGPDSVSEAMENLRSSFCFVGLTERFSASLLLLDRLVPGVGTRCLIRNVNRRRPPWWLHERALLSRIEQLNALDLELYQRISLDFEREARDLSAARCRRLDLTNQIRSKAIAIRRLLSRGRPE